ncbi:hypothetical protein AUJ78_01295 [Candidatus Peregrinibacteria bacterium CG1_02_41_10]|nr:MAG: hypothetical protein AUJ78_01295 [Candidatus Peregrinibacteria bacterium CG1_02_41_10]
MNSFLSFDKFHLLGIGGIGLSALAQILQAQGRTVSGSDESESEITQALKKKGIKIFIGHSEKNLPLSNVKCQMSIAVIYSLAIPRDNPELKLARKLKLPLFSYPQALGELTKEKFTIAVCGTHGKSTTTAMLAKILIEGNLNPSVVIGTKVNDLGGTNARVADSNYLLIEACEYKEAFLNYQPNLIVVTNLEPDHLDYYKTPQKYYQAFVKFFRKLGPTGQLVIFNQAVLELLKLTPLSEVWEAEPFLTKLPSLQVPGAHNRENAAVAYAAARALNVPDSVIQAVLANFTGTWRRFESLGKTSKGAIIYSDYGHHPTAVRATLSAAREKYPDQKIICVFQPHQYNRTHYFLEEYAHAFFQADQVIIPNIYAARDTKQDLASISPEKLVKSIQKHHPNVLYGNGLENTLQVLQKTNGPNDLILLMGAGDVYKLGEKLVKD